MSMNIRQSSLRLKQLGLGGLLLSAVIAGATMLTVAGVVMKANRDSYQTPSKVRIEVANQLMQSGLRHWSGLIRSETQLQALLDRYANNEQVVLGCSKDKELPESLSPQQSIDVLETPNATDVIHLKGVFAPYDCNKPIGIDNYRLTFEIHGQTHCNASIERNTESCIVRSIAMNAYAGDEYNPKIKSPIGNSQPRHNKTGNRKNGKPKSSNNNHNNTGNDKSEELNTRRGRNVQ